MNEAPSLVLPWLGVLTAILGLLTTWFWNLSNKGRDEKKQEKNTFESKIHDIEQKLASYREKLTETSTQLNNEILKVSISTLNREEANLMVEEKLKPLRDMLTQNKDDLKEVKQDQKQILHTLNNLMVAFEGQRQSRRKQDIHGNSDS